MKKVAATYFDSFEVEYLPKQQQQQQQQIISHRNIITNIYRI